MDSFERVEIFQTAPDVPPLRQKHFGEASDGPIVLLLPVGAVIHFK